MPIPVLSQETRQDALEAMTRDPLDILVVGGGISGMTAALEAAETGKQVVLVEKRPYLGGRVSQVLMVPWRGQKNLPEADALLWHAWTMHKGSLCGCAPQPNCAICWPALD